MTQMHRIHIRPSPSGTASTTRLQMLHALRDRERARHRRSQRRLALVSCLVLLMTIFVALVELLIIIGLTPDESDRDKIASLQQRLAYIRFHAAATDALTEWQ
jgi:hypothetical protein